MSGLKFNISYVSRLPLIGDSPSVSISSNKPTDEIFDIFFVDADTDAIVTTKKCKVNQTVTGDRQWYTNWIIYIFDSKNNLIYSDRLNLKGKTVFIKIDAYALGDNIAWIPYVEEFRKKHSCNVICSTFHNYLFERDYPQILFAVPNTQISNVYAQYYIGASTEPNLKYCPLISTNAPLQSIASKSLGLDSVEIIPRILSPNFEWISETRYVCISEHASSENKEWKAVDGWQDVVDFLRAHHILTVVISKEPTKLKNVIDRTGDINLFSRILDIKYSNFFMGVSSGLSWVAWALGKPVVLISDCTPSFHEFQSNVIRLGGKELSVIDYNASKVTSVEEVISALKVII